MRVLYCTHTSERYVGCAELSDQQVVCGPNWQTRMSEQGYSHIQTPRGIFDIKTVLGMLPEHQQPDMIAVWADSSCYMQPRGFSEFKGPKVLLIGDTHHLQRPIEAVIDYAKAEPWDYLIAFDNRHHLHFFREAGCENLYWLPGLNASARWREFNLQRQRSIAFVGQIGQYHPRRKSFLQEMQRRGLPVQVMQIPGAEALDAYERSLISLECTLNSNVGLRTFEVLAAGGMLLADRPSPQSGMDLLFEDGKHLMYYDSLPELMEKASFLLNNPQEVLRIAQAGHQEAWKNHSPERKRQELMDIVWRGIVNPKYELEREPRMRRSLAVSGVTFPTRVQLYQTVQELHRTQEEVHVLYYNKNDDYEPLEDLMDLPRVQCGIVSDDGQAEGNARKLLQAQERCRIVDQQSVGRMWDLLVVPQDKQTEIQNSPQLPFGYRQMMLYDGAPQTAGIKDAKRHIMIYTDDPYLGGAAHFDHTFSLALARDGYQVSIAQSYNEHQRVREREAAGIKHYWLYYDTLKEFGRTVQDAPEALRYFQEEKPELIVFSDCCPFSNFAAKRAALQLKIPFIEIEHATVPMLAEKFSMLLDERERLYKEAAAVVAVSQASKECLRQLFRLPQDKGDVVYLGRPSTFFKPRNGAMRQSLRDGLDIPPAGIVCFTAARFDALKGYDLQFMAMQQLKKSAVWPKLFFVWAGALGDMEPQVREFISRQGLEDKVHLLGMRNDVAQWLDAADLFVLPSFTEGVPLSIMEAMAKHVPVLATAVGGIPEVLAQAGIVLPDPNQGKEATVAVLAAMLELLATDQALRERIGETCQQRARELFSESSMLEGLQTVIRNAVPEKAVHEPEVSVIIPIYNGADYLRETITSVLAQNHADFELLLLDDGSTDNSLAIAREFTDSRIIVIAQDKNKGLVENQNCGLRLAKGKYIFILGQDDVCAPERLTKQLSFLRGNPQVGICGSWMKTFGTGPEMLYRYPVDTEAIKCQMLFCNPLGAPSVAMRRELVTEKQIYFREDYAYAEDYDYWAQAMQAGVGIANIPEVLVNYRIHDKQVTQTVNDTQLKAAAKVRADLIRALGLEPTERELELHELAAQGQFLMQESFLTDLAAWFTKLVHVNSLANLFSAEALQESLRLRLEMFCRRSQMELGEQAIQIYKRFEAELLKNK